MTSKNPIVQKALNATTKTYDPNRRPSVIVGEINRKCPKLSAKVDAWFVWVEFRDKKGVKGRLPDAIMAEPGFPRDKLEVADVRADSVLFTVKGNPYVNAKFAVTTKSGRSVVIEAPNYKAAEKEAKRRFGAGCIVDLVGNSEVAANDKWIDDFHVIVTAEKPDPALVEALKKKAAAWKVCKRNLSDKAADEAHEKAKHEVATVAKRLGAKLEQLGAVLRVVMPNAVAVNFNYKNKYQWFVVTPSMSGACILAGNEYREDAQEVFKEIKDEEGISCKVVARRTLERAGIDPNVSESWAKGIRKAVANAKFKEGQRVVEIPSKFGSMGTGTIEWLEDDPKEPQRARVRFDKGGTWVMDIRHLRAANANASTANDTSKAKNSTRNYEMKSTNPIVQKALNATVAKNANEPLIRYIKSNIQTKFPQASLEGYTDGVTSLIERGNGKITILADRKARPALDQLKAKFEPDYIFAFVDYGRGKTGFTMTPRAHTQRGEFKVANAVVTNAMVKKQFGNVTAFTFGDGLYSGINVGFGPKIEGETPKEVIAKAKPFLAEFEKAVAGIKNAIAWMSAL